MTLRPQSPRGFNPTVSAVTMRHGFAAAERAAKP